MRTLSNRIEVAQKYRTNELSKTPGGVKVVVVMKSGLKKIYNRVKFPEKYARAIHGNDISEIIILE